ncbi:AbrB/MazE/SpoVT family DNA-binding domain-containing protein [Thiobaca trueperi]|nr:AbrB/MazE/SpoVT family DNA-binding domain-containing protein [Thiobaca trueperi]
MLAKMTVKNQLTLPKAVTDAVGASDYFEVETRNGQIILTPVRIQRADGVRARLAELNLSEQDIQDAVDWARQAGKPVSDVS